MTKQELVRFIEQRHLAVLASVGAAGEPQAALVGVAVTPELEVLFDTVSSSRKCRNLRARPEAALVIGWEAEASLQIEGLADEPDGAELEALKQAYFRKFPEGRERQGWPGITYFRVRPRWLRYSDFSKAPPLTIELHLP